MSRAPPPHEVLTVSGIPAEDLPNGTSTVLTVSDAHGRPVATAIIDDAGYVRKVGDGGYFPSDYSARPRETH